MKTLKHDLPTKCIDGSISCSNWVKSLQYEPTVVIIDEFTNAIKYRAKTVPSKQAQRSAALIGIITELDCPITFKNIMLDCAIITINNL